MVVLGLRFCARAFSSCGKRGPLFIAVRGPLTVAAFLVAEHRLQTRRLSKLWLTGLVAPRHVGSSQTRARTRVPCNGRQILNHCATREARVRLFNHFFFVSTYKCSTTSLYSLRILLGVGHLWDCRTFFRAKTHGLLVGNHLLDSLGR